MDKIKLHAVYTKEDKLIICDQEGREFEGEPESLRTYGSQEPVILEVELEAPHWPFGTPRANIRISVPLQVEERLPDWMVEHLQDRL